MNNGLSPEILNLAEALQGVISGAVKESNDAVLDMCSEIEKNIDNRLGQFDARMEQLEGRLDRLDTQTSNINSDIGFLKGSVESLFARSKS